MILYTGGPVRIAYDEMGKGGPPLVVIPGWVSHLSFDWETPEIRQYYQQLAAHRRLIRYDKRGTGLSDRTVGQQTYSLNALADDLERVLDSARLECAALLGWSEAGPIALTFAARHPQRVSHLVLYGTSPGSAGSPDFDDPRAVARRLALLALVRSDWGLGSRLMANLLMPDIDEQRFRWFTDYQRACMSPSVAADFLEVVYRMDVRHLLPSIATPALVVHRRQDPLVPALRGEALAAALPTARLVLLEGAIHPPYFSDAESVTRVIDEFLGVDRRVAQPLSRREQDVLRLVIEGCPNREIAERLCISPATVGRHMSSIFTKLQVSTRAAATSHALRQHLV